MISPETKELWAVMLCDYLNLSRWTKEVKFIVIS